MDIPIHLLPTIIQRLNISFGPLIKLYLFTLQAQSALDCEDSLVSNHQVRGGPDTMEDLSILKNDEVSLLIIQTVKICNWVIFEQTVALRTR